MVPNTGSIEPRQMRHAIASLEASKAQWEADAKNLKAIVALQQQQIKDFTASVREQASLLQKVSTQLQLIKTTPQVVSNNN